jgi:hypothetical protein
MEQCEWCGEWMGCYCSVWGETHEHVLVAWEQDEW